LQITVGNKATHCNETTQDSSKEVVIMLDSYHICLVLYISC